MLSQKWSYRRDIRNGRDLSKYGRYCADLTDFLFTAHALAAKSTYCACSGCNFANMAWRHVDHAFYSHWNWLWCQGADSTNWKNERKPRQPRQNDRLVRSSYQLLRLHGDPHSELWSGEVPKSGKKRKVQIKRQWKRWVESKVNWISDWVSHIFISRQILSVGIWLLLIAILPCHVVIH